MLRTAAIPGRLAVLNAIQNHLYVTLFRLLIHTCIVAKRMQTAVLLMAVFQTDELRNASHMTLNGWNKVVNSIQSKAFSASFHAHEVPLLILQRAPGVTPAAD